MHARRIPIQLLGHRRNILVLTCLVAGTTPISGQNLYDFGNPSAEEQYHIELINRARANPPAEGARLAATSDPLLLAPYTQFGVDLALMQSEFNAIASAPPVAPNAQLASAASGHSQWMLTNDIQSHDQTNPPSSSADRIAAAGYSATASAENIFAYSKGVYHGHAGFQVDWGYGGTGGMQAGRGHRTNIHNPIFREIGVANLLGSNTNVGPEIVTQNFGRPSSGAYFGTGVAYYDLNGNAFYDPGEGIAGLGVSVDGATQSCLTADGGGWALPIPNTAATRNVHFSGLGFDTVVSMNVPSMSNAKADLMLTYSPPIITSSDQATPQVAHTITFTAVPGATSYRFQRWTLLDAPTEDCETADAIQTTITGSYAVLSQTIRHSGNASFHLVNATGNRQILELAHPYLGGPSGTMDFQSQIALSTPSESFKVQIQEYGASDWIDADHQSGGAVETAFSQRVVDLTAMSGKLFRIRFLLEYDSGSYFPTTSDSAGWFIDAIRFNGIQRATNEVATTLSSLTTSFTPDTATYLLSVSPIISNRDFPGARQTLQTPDITTPPPPEPPPSLSSNTKLAKLKVRGALLKPSFKPSKRKYRAIAKPSLTKIRLRAVTAHDQANMKINGKPVASGTTSSLRIGNKTPTIRILIIAQDGSRKSYRIKVLRSS